MKTESQAIKLNYLRRHNIRLIISLLYKKPMSCLELSQEINISDVGARKIVKQLECHDMIKVFPETDSYRKRGNQHIRYTINADLGYFLVFQITHLVDKYFLFDFSGNVVLERKFSLPLTGITADDLEKLCEETRADLLANGISLDKIINVTLSVPGKVDEQARCFSISNMFRNFENDETGSFFRIFEAAFSAPVYAKNDVMFMLLGETEGGRYGTTDTLLYFFVGYGISTAIMYKGELVTGVRGYAGEIGGNHFGTDSTISMNTSLSRLVQKCSEYLEKNDVPSILKAYRENGTVREIVEKSAEIVGMEIANISNLLGIGTVFLGGDALQFGEKYIDIIRKTANRCSVSKIRILISDHRNIDVRGALSEAKLRAIDMLMERTPTETAN